MAVRVPLGGRSLGHSIWSRPEQCDGEHPLPMVADRLANIVRRVLTDAFPEDAKTHSHPTGSAVNAGGEWVGDQIVS